MTALQAFVEEPERRQRLTAQTSEAGPLKGVAVAVKDLYRVDGLPTRAGTRLPEELFQGDESWVVRKLRTSGGAVLGKTEMDEFAYCEPPPTKNPRDPRRTPGGSSGGSAAAVAAGICDLALGSQTLQSTIVPAAYCGVIGFKPTFDRVAFDGIPLAPSIDTVGFIASTMAALRKVVASTIPNWMESKVIGRPVLGLPEPWGRKQLHGEGWLGIERHTRVLRNAGYEVRPVLLPWNEDQSGWAAIVGDLLHGEMARVHASWFDSYRELYRPRTRAAVELGKSVSDERLSECVSAQETLERQLLLILDEQDIDCWICPAVGTVAPVGYQRTGDSWMTCFWSLAGLPCLTLPVFDGENGLPLGFQCVTRRDHDEELLVWGADIEACFKTS